MEFHRLSAKDVISSISILTTNPRKKITQMRKVQFKEGLRFAQEGKWGCSTRSICA